MRSLFVLVTAGALWASACSAAGSADSVSCSPASTWQIPKESRTPVNTIRLQTIPDSFHAATIWANVVKDRTQDYPEARVYLYSVTLYARRGDGTDVVLEKNLCAKQPLDGGLFLRNPWFGENYYEDMPKEVLGSSQVLDPGKFADNVLHPWGDFPRPKLPAGTKYCWGEATFLACGSGLIQFGVDIWREPDTREVGEHAEGEAWNHTGNNREMCTSPWFAATGNWQSARWGLHPGDTPNIRK